MVVISESKKSHNKQVMWEKISENLHETQDFWILNVNKETNKIEIKPSQIDMGKEINKIGNYEANINLHAEVLAKIHIEVVKVEETK